MPTKNCVQVKNKLYFWNEEAGKFDVYTHDSIPLRDCPPEILEKFMRLLSEKIKHEEQPDANN